MSTVVVLATVLAGVGLPGGTPPAVAAQTRGLPVFTGPAHPVPAEPVPYTTDGGGMMRAIYEREKGGTDFWMDRMLARPGNDPAGPWLMTRGRAAFMKTHDPSVIGFGGQLAYWESIDNREAYSVTIGSGGLREDVSRRLQTPSYWKGEYDGGDGGGLHVVVTKFITQNNAVVTNLAVTNTGTSQWTLPVRVASPYATRPAGDELTGLVESKNRLTTIFPRLSADGMRVEGTALVGDLTASPNQTVRTKVVLGLVTEELPDSLREYDTYRELTPDQAFARQTRTYNQWWADNVPYIDVPDEAVKKYIYYRWWLMRYNYLDAEIPGNDFQFPTSVEGALGYNNAIALTIPMFIQDLKYLRDPLYSYGPWVSVGEVSRDGRFSDNPGDPENWSNSYTQYISHSALQSYQIHGGQPAILRNLAHYAEQDVEDQLATYDPDGNFVLAYNSPALTGNDADVPSFAFFNRPNERTESAYVYSNALAGAQAYELLGDTGSATKLRETARQIQQGILTTLWNPNHRVFEQRDVRTGQLIPWKEINNYYPFTAGLVPDTAEYREALRLWSDPAQYPIFPFYTANQADKAEAAASGRGGSNNFSQINSTVTFRFFDSVLRNYPSEHVDATMFKELLYWNAWAGYVGGDTRYPDTNEFWFNWNPSTGRFGRSGIHHTILGSNIWTIVEDVAGLRPRTDRRVDLWPIDIGWDHFTVNNLSYRGSDLTIVWDRPGDGTFHYPGVPEGFSGYVDGSRVFTVDSLTHLVYDPRTGGITFPGGDGEISFAAAAPSMRAPTEVALRGERIVTMFQRAGVDLSATGGAPNLARTATPSASHTAPGSDPAAATNGFTVNAPLWSSQGSGRARDWFQLDFGRPATFDDAVVYFANDRSPTGASEPAMYTLQYQDGDTWVDVPGQVRAPASPLANRNHVRFPPVTAQRVRLLVTHLPGHFTALKEIQVRATGTLPPAAGNSAPHVLAMQDPAFRRPQQARLRGVVKDDALPAGTLTTEWSQVGGPGTAIVDDPHAANAVATFTEPGDYVLRLSASDGERVTTSDVPVSVEALGAVVNVAPFATPSASHTSPWESVAAVNDGIDPPRSNDTQNRRWGTWPQEGTQWVQLDWPHPVRVDSADVFFFDDGGGVRVPASWKVQYWDGTAFVDVAEPTGYPVAADRYNHVGFAPVTTSRMRVELRSGLASVGLLEWKAGAVTPASLRPLHVPTTVGALPDLPDLATKVYDDGARLDSPVVWEPVDTGQVSVGETSFTVRGVVEGTGLTAQATVYVRRGTPVTITFLADEEVVTSVGTPPALPPTVLATFNDGSRDNVTTAVAWDPVDPDVLARPGRFTVDGHLAGTALVAHAHVTVRE